jgi:hypothetical protein
MRSRVTSRVTIGRAARRGAACTWLARVRVTRACGARAPLAIGVVAVLLTVVPALLLAGCGEEAAIVTQELVIDEPLGSAAVTDVEIDMGAGKLTLAPGAAGLISGTVRYNRESWKPAITRSDKSLTIKQGGPKDLRDLGGETVNEWDLALGRAPMRLEVTAGAHEGTYELGGLTLQKLSIKDGASKTRVSFSAVNPGQMASLEYSTGASSVALTGLANANFKNMEFKGAAGDYSLDFSGELRTSGTVKVEAGAGSVEIVVPAETAARVTVSGTLNSVSTEGLWTVEGQTYSTTPAGSTGQDKSLTVTVKANVGSVTLIAR